MAIALDARHIDSYFQRGEHYRKREIFASAVADYTAVLKLAPAHVDALTGRADVWYALDDYEKAEADYRKAQQLDPENQQLEGRLYVLRQKRAAKRNPIQQLKNYLAAPVNTPTQKVLDLYNQAVMRDKEDGAGKLADLSEAIALKPSFTRAYILRGALYYHQGEFEKALADDTWVIEKLPRNASSRLNRGEVYLAMGNFAAAKEDFEKALSLEKTNIYAQAGLALAYFRLGDVTKARALWEELVEHSPGFKTPIWVEKRLSWHPNLTQILRELLALPI
jgi:tetratricopeptide (TPR) repeat protein